MCWQVADYLRSHDWITTERQYFGQPNTAYDFEANDPKEAGRRIQKLQETKDSLSKKVNMRAMNMLGKAEEQVRAHLASRMMYTACGAYTRSYNQFRTGFALLSVYM